MDASNAEYSALTPLEQQAIAQGAQIGSHPQSIHALGRQARAVVQQVSRQVMALCGLPGRGYQVLWLSSPGEAIWQLLWGLTMGLPEQTQIMLHRLDGALTSPIWQQVLAAMAQHFPPQKWLCDPLAKLPTQPTQVVRLWATLASQQPLSLPASFQPGDWLLVDGLDLDASCALWPEAVQGRCLVVFRRWQQRSIAGLTCLLVPDEAPLAPLLGQGSLQEESLLLGTPPIAWLAGELQLLNAAR